MIKHTGDHRGIFYAAALIFMLVGLVFAGSDTSVSTPEVSSFAKDRGTSPSLYTGDMGFSTPILSVPGPGGLDYPIVLSYAAGIKLEQEASLVGLGWNLGPGSISTEFIGIPDSYEEDSNDQYAHTNHHLDVDLGFWDSFRVKGNRFAAIMIRNGVHVGRGSARTMVYGLGRSLEGSYLNSLDLKPGNNPKNDTGFWESGTDADNSTPDIYHLSGNGFGGRVILTGNGGNRQFTLQKLSSANTDALEINKYTNGFRVRAADGTIYHYDYPLYIKNPDTTGHRIFCDYGQGTVCIPGTEIYARSGPHYVVESSANPKDFDYEDDDTEIIITTSYYEPIPYAWSLTKIESPGGENWIEFNYEKIEGFKFKAPGDGGYTDGALGGEAKAYGWKEIAYLTSIETPTHIAEFVVSDREDNKEADGSRNPKKLDKVVLKSKAEPDTILKSVHFDYDYSLVQGVPNSDAGGRLTLKSITEYGVDESDSLPSSEFEYGNNQNYNKYKFDRWGNYYSLGSKGNHNPLGAPEGTEDADAWSLKKVDYPTGGSVEWEYETDRYARVAYGYPPRIDSNREYNDNHYGGGIRIKSITVDDGMGQEITSEYLYNLNGFDLTEDDGYGSSSAGESSGVLTVEPAPYRSKGDMRQPYGSSQASNYVGYSNVVVIPVFESGQAKYGYVEHKFTTAVEYPNTGAAKAVATFDTFCDEQRRAGNYVTGGSCDMFSRAEDTNCLFSFEGQAGKKYTVYTYLGSKVTASRADSDGIVTINLPDDLAYGKYFIADWKTRRVMTVWASKEGRCCLDLNKNNRCDYFDDGSQYGLAKLADMSGAVDRDYKRGLEYETRIYNSTHDVVSKTTSDFSFIEVANWVGGKSSEPVENVAGWTRVDKTTAMVDGMMTETSFEYDSSNGMVTKTVSEKYGQYTSVGQSKIKTAKTMPINNPRRIAEVEYYTNTGKHILNRPLKTWVKDEAGNVLAYSENHYKDFGSGRIYPEWSGAWLDKNEDGDVDGGELIKAYINDYDEYGNPLETEDALGNKAYIRYTSDGLRVEKTWNDEYGSSSNPVISYEYYPTGALKKTTNMNGATTEYRYDEFFRLVKLIAPYDSESSPSMEAEYYMTPTSLPNKIVTKAKLDSGKYSESIAFSDGLGRGIQTQAKESGNDYIVSDVEYNEIGKVPKGYKPFRATTSGNYWEGTPSTPFSETFYHTDPLARAKRITPPGGGSYTEMLFGSEQFYTGDEGGRVSTLQVIDGNGHVTKSLTDAFGNTPKVIDADGGITTSEHDLLGNALETTDPEGRISTSTYDTLGRALSFTHPDMGTTTYDEYDDNGNLLQTTDANGNTIRYEYDALGRGTRIDYPVSPDVLSYYDNGCGNADRIKSWGRTCKVVDGSGTTNYEYDLRGRNTREINFLNHQNILVNPGFEADDGTAPYGWNSAGQGYSSDGIAGSRAVKNSYASTKWKVKQDVAMEPNTDYTISAHVKNEGSAMARVYVALIDASGDASDSSDADAVSTTCSDNDGGHPHGIGLYATPSTTEYSRVSCTFKTNSETRGARVHLLSSSTSTSVWFDNLQLEEGTEATEFFDNTFITGYEFTSAGAIDTLTDPVGVPRNYEYNNLGQLESLKMASKPIASYQYNPTGSLKRTTFGNGVVTDYGYNDREWMDSISTTGMINNDTGAAEAFRAKYVHDPVGNIEDLYETRDPALTIPIVASFGYDNLDRLTFVDDKADYYGGDISFSYDKVGNRLSRNEDTYSYKDDTNQLENDSNHFYGYDANGNMIDKTNLAGNTTTYVWDEENRLARIEYPSGSVNEFGYDAGGRRFKKVDSKGITLYLYGKGLSVIYEEMPPEDNGRIAKPGSTVTTTTVPVTTTTVGAASKIGTILQLGELGSAVAGTTVALEATLENTGTGNLVDNCEMWFWATNYNWLGNTPCGNLTAGASGTYTYDWAIPTTANLGDYNYWAKAYYIEGGGYRSLTGWKGPEQFSVTDVKGKVVIIRDAEITSVTTPSDANAGDALALTAEIENTGNVEMDSGCEVWFYVSEYGWLGYASCDGLDMENSGSYTYDWSVPATAADDDYKLWARVYYKDDQGKYSLLANWAVSGDFHISEVSRSAEIISMGNIGTASVGDTVTFTAEVENTGDVDMDSGCEVWFWSNARSNRWFGPADCSNLDTGATDIYGYDWTVPTGTSQGDYALWARVYQKDANGKYSLLSGWDQAENFQIV